MIHDEMGSIAVFLISKSVEPNEKQKVVASDFGKEITTSTERYLFRDFLGISNRKVKTSKIKALKSNKWPNPF